MPAYKYYNDDRSLLRVGPGHLAEQWAPSRSCWAPGGYPSLRAAHLSYEQARNLAYRLQRSFGADGSEDSFDLGPEEYSYDEYRFYEEEGEITRWRAGVGYEAFMRKEGTWQKGTGAPSYKARVLLPEEALSMLGPSFSEPARQS